MLTKKDKVEIVKNLKKELKDNKLAAFCNFEGISVAKQRELKKKFKEIDGRLFVVKRRLVQKVLFDEKVEAPEINGPLMVGLAKDEVLPAKIMFGFKAKKKEKLDFAGGIAIDDNEIKFLSKEEMEDLARLPSKEELRSRLVGLLQAPIAGFQHVLKGNIQKLTYVLANIKSE